MFDAAARAATTVVEESLEWSSEAVVECKTAPELDVASELSVDDVETASRRVEGIGLDVADDASLSAIFHDPVLQRQSW